MKKMALASCFVSMVGCKSAPPEPPHERVVATSTSGVASAPATNAPADDGLPGPELRARLDPMATCWRRAGAPSAERPWRRNGGLCNRTFLRTDSSGELSLSMVFPQGPDGPIRATEGFARFRAVRDDVDVVLFVRVGGATSPPVARLEVGTGTSPPTASLLLTKKSLTKIATASDLEGALGKEIDHDHDPARKNLTMRQDCKVLPNMGQRCEMVPTTEQDRARMTADLAAEAKRKRDWLAKNREAIHAMRNALYPFDDAPCTTLATGD